MKKIAVAVVLIVAFVGVRQLFQPGEGSATKPRAYVEALTSLPLDANFDATPFASFEAPDDKAKLEGIGINRATNETATRLSLDGKPIGYSFSFGEGYMAVTRLSGNGHAGIRTRMLISESVMDVGSPPAVEVCEVNAENQRVGACYNYVFNGFTFPLMISGYDNEGIEYGRLLEITGNKGLLSQEGFSVYSYKDGKSGEREDSKEQHRLRTGETFRWFKDENRSHIIAWEKTEGGSKRGLYVESGFPDVHVAYFGASGKVEGDVITFRVASDRTIKIIVAPVDSEMKHHGAGWTLTPADGISYGQFRDGEEIGERKRFK